MDRRLSESREIVVSEGHPRRIYYMKALYLVFITVLILSSCPGRGGRIYDSFQGRDRIPPKVISYNLVSSKEFRLVYDESVALIDMELNGEKFGKLIEGSIFMITFPEPLKRGESAVLSVTAEDLAGNTSRASFALTGPNDDIPLTLINEVSIKGTAASPDRIELRILEEGNTAGITVKDGSREHYDHEWILPELDVISGDIILLYWDTDISGNAVEKRDENFTYSFSAGSDTTLSGTNGAIAVYTSPEGEILDGIIYTTGTSELCNGYGNTKTEEAAFMLIKEGEWTSEPISSLDVTSSRVIARYPGGIDSNSADDFFITAARKSTFGEPNQFIPYEE